MPPIDAMNPHRHAAVRALLVQEATLDASSAPATTLHERTPSPQRARRRPRLALTSAVGLVAVVTITAGIVVSRPLPAYAVSGGNGRAVEIEVNRLEGAQALEDALAERGITADITYLPSDQQCRPGRYPEIRTPGLTLGVSADRFQVTIPPGAVSDGETFVLSAAVTPIDHGARAIVAFGITRGPIAPCGAVEAT